MHDALARYEPDTVVEDIDDFDPIALPRVPTSELTVHVQLDDGWHRMAPDGTETACGAYVNVRLQIDTRSGRSIEHPLAPCECWTTRERGKADAAYRDKFGADFKPLKGMP